MRSRYGSASSHVATTGSSEGLFELVRKLEVDVVVVAIQDRRLNLPTEELLRCRLAGIEGATFNTTTDSLEAIRDRGDAAWITAISARFYNDEFATAC